MTGLLYLALTWCAASMLLGKKGIMAGSSGVAQRGLAADCSCSKPVRNVGIKKTNKASLLLARVAVCYLEQAMRHLLFDLAQLGSSA